MPQRPHAAGTLAMTRRVNGGARRVVPPQTTLLDALRERMRLTGTKKGCGRGECGAGTTHGDGRRALACITFAVMAEDKEVTTIEWLADGDRRHPVQAGFIEHDAYPCGFCTHRQIMSAVARVREGHAKSEAEIREFMSGNGRAIGAKGIGELGAMGVGPAIASAVHHATGIRLRDGPIRPERLIRAASRQE